MTEEFNDLPPEVKQQAEEELARRKGTSPEVVRKFTKKKIDQTPAMEDQYEQGSEYFSKFLEEIDKKDLNQELERIDMESESLGDEDDERAFELEDRRFIVKKLRSIKDGVSKEKIMDGLAKTRVFELHDVANHYNSRGDSNLSDTIHQLDRAVYNLAQARFPEEFKKQEERREEKTRAWVEKKREELMKIKVS